MFLSECLLSMRNAQSQSVTKGVLYVCLLLHLVRFAALGATVSTPTTIDCEDTTFDGQDITVDGATLTVDCKHTIRSLIVRNGGVVTHSPGNTNGLRLAVVGDVTVETGGSISADGRGYGLSGGPGSMPRTDGGPGASYGGHGGSGSQNGAWGPVYGSVLQPVDLGSGAGGAGGGAIELTVGGTLRVDGTIAADGNADNGAHGGGSGGSVWLTVGSLSGTGMIRANGGRGDPNGPYTGGGGGGGRIAIYHQSNSFQGSIQAYGGSGLEYGGAGTVYVQAGAERGPILISGQGPRGPGDLGTNEQAFAEYDVVVDNGLLLVDQKLAFKSLTVRSNGWVSHYWGNTNGLRLAVVGDVTVETGGSISADGRGYGLSGGPGSMPRTDGGPGASYGGHGGSGSQNGAWGPVYGSVLQPVDLGSGAGGVGGGAIELTVGGTLRVDGTIAADGNADNGAHGGGSGGSVWLTAGSLSGTGMIRANGGRGDPNGPYTGGGGGGGRIAIYHQSNSFQGSIQAYGGSGLEYGGAGTVYVQAGAERGPILISGQGPRGPGDLGTNEHAFAEYDVVVDNGLLLVDQKLAFKSLTVRSNGWVSHYWGNTNGLRLAVVGDVTVETGGSISADGRGYGLSGGPGSMPRTDGGPGASYGGHGGSGSQNGAWGPVYGSVLQPVDLGSGAGGAGGGAIELTVGGTLRVDGTIAADGNADNGAHGGGSGGSVWLTVGSLSGTGMIRANGGRGDPNGPYTGGGGGGGRIAVYYGNPTEFANISAAGGNGYERGGDGTVYMLLTLMQPVILDQPQKLALRSGDTADFKVRANGTLPLVYQWQFNRVDISGATAATLTIPDAQPDQSGSYRVTVSNFGGAVTSLVATLTVTNPFCAVVPAGIVAWWKGDGSAFDSAGLNHALPTLGYAPGLVGQAFQLTGFSTPYIYTPYLDCGSAPTLNFTNTSFTLSAWARPAAASGNGHHEGIVSRWAGGGGASWWLGRGEYGGFVFWVDADGGWGPNRGVGSPVASLNTWHHVVGVYDHASGTLFMYVDGELGGTSTGAPVAVHPTPGVPVTIGAWNEIPGAYREPGLQGLVDEVALFSRALSAGEIAELYTAGSTGMCVGTALPEIVQQPRAASVVAGGTVSLSTVVQSVSPPTFQWRHEGQPVAGATTPTLTLDNTLTNQAGNYDVVVSNANGSVTSEAVALTVITAGPCAVVPAGIVAWWKGDGSAFDSAGLNHALPTLGYAPGLVGQAFQLTGFSTPYIYTPYLDCGSAPTLNFTNTSFTLSAWARPAAASGNGHHEGIVSRWAGGGGASWWLGRGKYGGFMFWVDADGGWGPDRVVGSPVASLNTWHHVAGVYDHASGTLFIYVDGELGGTSTGAPVAVHPTPGVPVTIGAWNEIPGAYREPGLQGLVDEVALFSRALSAGEIAELYTAGSTGMCVGTALPEIVRQPRAASVVAGGTVSLSTVVQSVSPPTFQWRHEGQPVAGATTPTLTLDNTLTNQAGNYDVVVSNANGSVTSEAVALTVITAGPCAVVPAGIVAWWKGDGSAFDSAGLNHALPTLGYAPGLVGQAFQLTGFSTPYIYTPYLDCGSAPTLNFTNTSFTLSAWARPAAASGKGHHEGIVSRWAGGGGASWWLGRGEYGGFVFWVDADGGWGPDRVVGSPVASLNTWHHVVGVYDHASGTLFIYVDGELGGTSTGAPVAVHPTPGVPVTIGAWNAIPGAYREPGLQGLVDEVALFSRALSAGEIAELYTAGSTGMCTAQDKPSILQQPRSFSALWGGQGFFEVKAASPTSPSYQWRLDGSPVEDATAFTLRLTNIQPAQAGSYDVVVSNRYGTVTSDVAVLTVITNIPDLETIGLTGPASALAGQPVSVSWTTTNAGNATANAPWQETLLVADNPAGDHATVLASFAISGSLGAGESLNRTPTVILPRGLSGNYWLVARVDSANQVAEGYGETNNLTVATEPIAILSPDLQAGVVVSPPTAAFGQQFAVTWAVTNAGNGPASASWSDRVYLSSASNSLAGATLLASASGTSPLAPGAKYTNTASITLPLSAQSQPGAFWLVAMADAADSQPESNETNNLASVPLAVTLPPLPNLAVREVAAWSADPVQPLTEAQPGQTILITWLTTNIGPANLAGGWNETVVLSSDDNVGDDLALASFRVTNSLPAGTGLVRTQSVSVPYDGPTGTLRFGVVTDSANEIIEADETDNGALAQVAFTVPATLSLLVPLTQVREDAVTFRASLTRNGDRTQPLMVTLSSSLPGELTVPASVTIPAGQATAEFEVRPRTDGAVDGPKVVILTATATGFPAASRQVTVLDVDFPHLSLVLDTNVVSEGRTVGALLTSDLVVQVPVIVSLTSSNPNRVQTPLTITIPAGEASVAFVLLAVEDGVPRSNASFNVTASAAGYNGSTATFTMQDADVPQASLTLSPAIVSEGAGPNATTATVTRSPVGSFPLLIGLETASAEVVMPATVSIPAGQPSVSFSIAAVDNSEVDGTRQAAIGVWVLETSTKIRLAEGAPAMLTITDDDGPTLKLALARKLVAEGLAPATTATVSRNFVSADPVVVRLTSSNTGEATVPPTVTIPANQQSVDFPVASVNDGVTDGNKTVIVSAAADGFTGGADVLTVTDVNLPDLVVVDLNNPTTAFTRQSVSLEWRLVNQGLIPLTNVVKQRVLLSRDPILGDATLLRDVTYIPSGAGLAPGDGVDQSLSVLLPLTPGDYWPVIVADIDNAAVEVDEENNTRIAQHPIQVGAEYSATVQTDVTAALAGTDVPLRGRVLMANGQPPEGRAVNIHVMVNGTDRVIPATAKRDGAFEALFHPLTGEGGHYTVGATHPGVSKAPVQDGFVLLGARLNPASLSLKIIDGSSASGSVALSNLSEIPLTNATVVLPAMPGYLNAAFGLSGGIVPGNGSLQLAYTVTGLAPTRTPSPFTIRVTTAEGVTADLTVSVIVEPKKPRLVADPASISVGMVRGVQRVVEFQLANEGGAATGPLTVLLPKAPWLSLASTNPMPSLAPGEINRVSLLLTPAADLALGDFTGSLALSCDNASLTVPFTFRSLSEAKGALLLTAVDEYTYYAEGAPKVTNATVTITDAISGQVVANGVTDARGEFFVPQAQEGYYTLDILAGNHSDYHKTKLLLPGTTNRFEAFLARQAVHYIWRVEPIEFEERVRVVVETVFETQVPMPVVVVEPTFIDLSPLTQPGQSMQVDFKISNHGLIAAYNGQFHFGENPRYQVTPLIADFGQIPAQSSFIIPVNITRIDDQEPLSRQMTTRAKAASMPLSTPFCDLPAWCGWTVRCGGRDLENRVGIGANIPGCAQSWTPLSIDSQLDPQLDPEAEPTITHPEESAPDRDCNTCDALSISFATSHESVVAVGIEQTFTVVAPQGGVRWYVDDQPAGCGLSFSYTFERPGTYTVLARCVCGQDTPTEVSQEITAVSIGVTELRTGDGTIPMPDVVGPIWTGAFDIDGIIHEDFPPLPICTFLPQNSQGFKVKIRVTSFPRSSSDWKPIVKWSYLIEGGGQNLVGEDSFTDWQGECHIQQPGAVGSYNLVIGVAIYDPSGHLLYRQGFDSDLYVRLGRGGFMPDNARWLKSAVTWAAGARTEQEAVNKLLYVGTLSRSRYVQSAGGDQNNPYPVLNGGQGNGACALYANLWMLSAKYVGVDDAIVKRVLAADGGLYITPPDILAFDDSHGDTKDINIEKYRWTFPSHAVGIFRGRVYDPTFKDQNGPITYNSFAECANISKADEIGLAGNLVTWWLLHHITTSKGCTLYLPYSGNDTYNYWCPPSQSVSALLRKSAAATSSPNPVGISDLTLTKIDDDNDGRSEAIAATFSLNSQQSETVAMAVALASGNQYISARESRDSTVLHWFRLELSPGSTNITLRFSGQDILDSKLDGPYAVKLCITAEDGATLAEVSSVTPPWLASQFSEVPADLVRVTEKPVDPNLDGMMEALSVTTYVKAYQKRSYTVSGVLSVNNQFVASALASGIQDVGDGAIEVHFDAREIWKSGLSGPFTASLTLEDDQGNNIGSTNYMTQSYSVSQFTPSALRFRAPYSDARFDTDNNGLYDTLSVSANVDVQVAGKYTVAAWLQGNNGQDVTRSETNILLSAGSQTVTLLFNGRAIQHSGVDGPYVVVYLVGRDASDLVVDSGRLIHTTAAYLASEFDPLLVPNVHVTGNYSDDANDDDGDGVYDRLLIKVQVAAAMDGTVYVDGHLRTQQGRDLGLGSGSGTVQAGQPAWIALSFPAFSISAAGENGPYKLEQLNVHHSSDPFHGQTLAQAYTTATYLVDWMEPGHKPEGVCAKVRLAMSQDAVVTRSAFRATLELVNEDPAALLQNMEVRMNIFDTSGALANDRFGIQGPLLNVLTAVDGTGLIPPASSGSAAWTLIPAENAAPTAPTIYRVGGVLSYKQNGQILTIPLEALPITVRPDAALYLKYFLQRDVISDDPFTPELEPSVPFWLATMVENKGAGVARNLTLSAPEITILDNEKGLLVQFNVLQTLLDGRPLSPTLTASFGDVAPGQRSTALYAMNANLQGLFTDYQARIEYMNSLNERRLSIFKDVEIHEMNHLVRVPFGDGRPAFLVNDDLFYGRPDPEHLPDTVHLSDGSAYPVAVVRGATPDHAPAPGNLEVPLDAPLMPPAGFSYLQVPDPQGATNTLKYRLVAVRNSVGTNLPPENVWQTDRTFIGMGRRPLRENILHLFDRNSMGRYTLVYEPAESSPTDPPSSEVAPLAASSPAQFPVRWSGRSQQGRSLLFDVWVAIDGDAFVPWLRNTTLPGAMYQGEVGKRYAYYSMAVDDMGNREPAPNTPDAQTTVQFNSGAPTLSEIADVATDEDIPIVGLALKVVDADTPLSELTFVVTSSNPTLIPPAGVTIQGTGTDRTLKIVPEANQIGFSLIVLTVSDDTSQSSRSFTVLVRPVNDPPVAEPDVVTRSSGKTVKVPASQLLANDTDIEFDLLTLTGVSPVSTKGVTVRLADGWVFYLPIKTMNEADTFTYSVADNQGGTATGLVSVQVLEPDSPQSLNILGANLLEDGAVRIDFVGIPGRAYKIQVTDSLGPAAWSTLGTVTAGDTGLFQYIDTDTTPRPMRFYRSVGN